MRYDDRKLHSVTMGGLNLIQGTDGPLANTIVFIDLTAFGQDDLSGPGIDVKLGVPSDGTESLSELRLKAVELAYEMVQRVSRVPLAELTAAVDKEPLFRSLND